MINDKHKIITKCLLPLHLKRHKREAWASNEIEPQTQVLESESPNEVLIIIIFLTF